MHVKTFVPPKRIRFFIERWFSFMFSGRSLVFKGFPEMTPKAKPATSLNLSNMQDGDAIVNYSPNMA